MSTMVPSNLPSTLSLSICFSTFLRSSAKEPSSIKGLSRDGAEAMLTKKEEAFSPSCPLNMSIIS